MVAEAPPEMIYFKYFILLINIYSAVNLKATHSRCRVQSAAVFPALESCFQRLNQAADIPGGHFQVVL
jgi:hypothetical protein